MVTALVSALSGIPVRHDIAMTGEVTLRGRVLPIGGLTEKTMAAYRAGIKTVLIPRENERDLDEIDKEVAAHLSFVLCDTVDDVLKAALRQPDAAQECLTAVPSPLTEEAIVDIPSVTPHITVSGVIQ